MKKITMQLTKQAKKQAERALRRDVERTCTPWSYQPKAPAALKEFSKRKDVQ